MIVIGLYGIKDQPNPETKTGYANVVHDHNMTILKDGKLIDFIQLERYTGVKHDSRMDEYIDDLLNRYIPNQDNNDFKIISVNSFLGNSFISKKGKIRIEPKSKIRVEDVLVETDVHFYLDRLEKKNNVQGYVMTHEFAHVATTLPFFGRFKDQSLLIHIDGGAYDSSSSVWYHDNNKIECIDYGWNELKDVVNNFNANPLSFFIIGEKRSCHLSLPGKLMGYSSFGNSREDIRSWLRENNYFLSYRGKPEDMLELMNREFGTHLKKFDTNDKFFMDIAATIQDEFEVKVLEFINRYKKKTDARYLYYSGGAALNIKTNSLIEKKCEFGKVFIPPCCNDSGLSLGAAYYLEYLADNPIEKLSPFINKINTKKDLHTNSLINSKDIDKICKLTAEGNVFGTYFGASEAGPRALGHRSIIARPDVVKIRELVSEGIKKREWYRPIAPVMTEKIGSVVLEESIQSTELARFMLGNFHVKKHFIQDFKGVIHTDGTVRAQIVYETDSENKFLYHLLTRLNELYQIKGLINTSFNVKGSPIVQTFENAMIEARKMGLNGVIMYDGLHQFEST